jgi:hypothetical protein
MNAILTDLLPRCEARLAEARCAIHSAAMQSEIKRPLSLMEARRLLDLHASAVTKLRDAIDAELGSLSPKATVRGMLSASMSTDEIFATLEGGR